MNLYYGLAMIALDGEAFVEQFREERIAEPRAMDFIERITAEVDPGIEAKGRAFRHMARVTVTTTDGRALTHKETHRRGSPENPVARDDLERKFDALAATVFGAERIAALKDQVQNLEQLDDVRALALSD